MSNLPLLPWQRDPRSVAAGLAATLARRIVEGELEPGALLTEVAAAAEAEVSRTPVREAFLQLEGWSLVRLLPKKGALVTSVSPAERRDLLDVRATWEARSVATMDPSPDTRAALVARLGQVVADQSDALERGDRLGFAALDFAFHVEIIAAGGNRVVREVMERLGPRLARLTYAAVEGTGPIRAFRDEHGELAGLVATGDAAAFEAAVRRHVETGHFPAGA